MDVVITTAQVPGRKPPVLVTADAVEKMKPGSVIVDMAASALGGNCELCEGRRDRRDAQRRDDHRPGQPAGHRCRPGASAFYARNISALLLGMVKDGALNLDFEDEVTKATVITKDGAVVSRRRRRSCSNPGGHGMTFEEIEALLTALTIFTLAILVGIAVISKVPATLHTPLMSGANSIHGIVLVGAMLIAAEVDDPIGHALSLVAVAFATMNVVGGYVVTDRMLQMFRKKPVAPKPGGRRARRPRRDHARDRRDPRPDRLARRAPSRSSSACRG